MLELRNLGHDCFGAYNANSSGNRQGTLLRFQQHQFLLIGYTHISALNTILANNHADTCYVLKSGEPDAVTDNITVCPALVHAVFSGTPHGYRFAWVSEWLAKLNNGVCVPPIVRKPVPSQHLRKELNIPDEAYVYGCHGGADSFDIPFVHHAVQMAANEGCHFVFLSIQPFCAHPRIKFIPTTDDLNYVHRFLATCNAMIHARARGETFGMSCAEFNILQKPVLTYGLSVENAHLGMLKNNAFVYTDTASCLSAMRSVCSNPPEIKDVFTDLFSPSIVMQRFKDVFLT